MRDLSLHFDEIIAILFSIKKGNMMDVSSLLSEHEFAKSLLGETLSFTGFVFLKNKIVLSKYDVMNSCSIFFSVKQDRLTTR